MVQIDLFVFFAVYLGVVLFALTKIRLFVIRQAILVHSM